MSRRKHKPATTHWVLVVGLVLQQGIALLAELGAATDLGHGTHWYPALLAVLGFFLQILSASGYNRARAAVELSRLAGVEPEPEPAPVKPWTGGLLDAIGLSPKRPRFIRHKTAESIVRAFTHADGPEAADPEGWGGVGPDGETFSLLGAIRSSGFWGFAHPESNTIRYWLGPEANEAEVLFFFAHELGHIADEHAKKFRRGRGPNDELRADLYGWVASEALAITRKALAVKP